MNDQPVYLNKTPEYMREQLQFAIDALERIPDGNVAFIPRQNPPAEKKGRWEIGTLLNKK